jgi:NAD(P)H-flavin reductase/hemoglobin-like flavoprotein
MLLADGAQCPVMPPGDAGTEPGAWLYAPPAPLVVLAGARPEVPAPEIPVPPPVDVAAIRRSLASLHASPQKCAGDFYGYLWAADPRLREMFPPVMCQQNERLFAALLKIGSLVDSPDLLSVYCGQLGSDHRKYGVTGEHYAAVGDALLRTLRRHCEAWDDRAEAAWTAAYAVVSAAMIAGAEAAAGPATWKGRVLGHRMLSADLAVLTIQTDQPIDYEPGQHVTVQHPKWPRVWRRFSIASVPVPGGDIFEIHVKKVSGGWVSTALTRDTEVPDEVTIGPPVGTMTANRANGHDLTLIGGGVAIAPMVALAEDVLHRDEAALAGGWGHRRLVTMFHGALTPLGLHVAPKMHELELTYPWFSYVPVVSEDPAFTGQKGNVTDVALEHDWTGRHVYLAGRPEMLASAAGRLSEAGMPEEDVHFDEPGV